MLTIIDTQTGNIQSVCNAFRRIGADIAVTYDAATVAQADTLILPGVGAIEPALMALHSTGIGEVLRRRVAEGVPLLGICLGMQMMADVSAENGIHPCLGLIPGRVKRLEPRGADCRVPNIGWYGCVANSSKSVVLFPPEANGHSFYFVHSYYFVCDTDAHIASTIEYGGQSITVAVEHGNLFGVQFHPEKSQDHGLSLLHRFLQYVQGTTRNAA